jgi:hypothetical protein
VTGPRNLEEAFSSLIASEGFRGYPLAARAAFLSAHAWLQPKVRDTLLIGITASLARNWRDQAARERGWRFGNIVLVLVQTVVARTVAAGELAPNRVKCVPKLPPPRLPASIDRRRIRPTRQPIHSSKNASKSENNSA